MADKLTDKSDTVLRKRRMRQRNLALLAVLVGLIVLFYLLTIVHLGGNAMP